jgi:hypothetical protein
MKPEFKKSSGKGVSHLFIGIQFGASGYDKRRWNCFGIVYTYPALRKSQDYSGVRTETVVRRLSDRSILLAIGSLFRLGFRHNKFIQVLPQLVSIIFPIRDIVLRDSLIRHVNQNIRLQ